jgi:hypothetical protein
MIERSRLSNSRDCALARGCRAAGAPLKSDGCEVKRLCSWLEEGACEALDRGYVRCQHPKSAPACAGASESLDVQLAAASLQIFTRADDGQLSKLTVSSQLVIEHQSTRSNLFRRRTDLISTRHSLQVRVTRLAAQTQRALAARWLSSRS